MPDLMEIEQYLTMEKQGQKWLGKSGELGK